MGAHRSSSFSAVLALTKSFASTSLRWVDRSSRLDQGDRTISGGGPDPTIGIVQCDLRHVQERRRHARAAKDGARKKGICAGNVLVDRIFVIGRNESVD